MSEPEKKLFKDWFDASAARQLGEQVRGVYPAFDFPGFVRRACKDLESLEMGGRVAQFSDSLAEFLPADKEEAIQILARSLPEALPSAEQITAGWLQWPLGKFIADHGLDCFECSMSAMIELTQRFSSEFAVRPFLEQRPQETLQRLTALTSHPSVHVRRWCSEGTRPLLPWGRKLVQLQQDPSPVWPILEALKDDPERYVQKSVANHLNDIAKTHPDLVLARCRKWMPGAGPGRQWVIRHALRTLIKNGNPSALELLGFPPVPVLPVQIRLKPAKICVGESLQILFRISNPYPEPQRLLIDYAVHFVRQKGKTGRKVFKWTTLELSPGESVELSRRHPIRITSVRALYPGRHRVELLLNGKNVAEKSFQLEL
ncbi:MAG: DNA alkylation repair protein [Kiritimatiellia bacterium]